MNTAVSTTPRAAAVPGGNSTAALVQALRHPSCYPHPVAGIEVIETHIAYVLLAGEFAYKIKKPVRLPFLDFSTLEARRRCCEEELRLNRRTAPQVYLGVVAIAGACAAPRMGGPGPALEYAVKMQRFPQEALFSHLARRGALQPEHVDRLADCLAAFHHDAAPSPRSDESAAGAAVEALANFSEIAALEPAAEAHEPLEALRRWTLAEAEALAGRFAARAAQGFERECHGDLHLGNVVLLDDRPVLFDCIEFSERLRRIDVMSDVAFAAMDFARHGLRRAAARFVNRYVERTGDHEGLALLRFYQVYRAMVRAKVAWIRARQEPAGGARREFIAYLDLARRLSRRAAPVLVLMHGLSASGKTTASELLVEALGAVRVRSDVERKRLHGLEALGSAAAAPGAGIYGERDSRDTYERLATLARGILAAGYPVVVDATFLRRSDRDRFRALAAQAGAGFQIAACTAPEAQLRTRVAEREHRHGDASDAGVAVLEAQLGILEPLGDDERVHSIRLDTGTTHAWKVSIESLARRFGAHGQ